MKKIFASFFTLFIVTYCFSQTPQAISYQAISRNALGQIIPNQIIAVRFSILENSANGSLAYQETQVATTNAFGLFTLEIGGGTPVYSTFPNINWGTGTKFLKTEIAPGGGTNYLVQGTTQLLSVPYALYAEKTKLNAGTGINITNGNTISGNYQAGTGVNITGNSISHNLVAGTGININSNVISATGGADNWQTDADGINYPGNIGIGVASEPLTKLSIVGANGTAGLLRFRSADTWQAAIVLSNTSVDPLKNTFTFSVGGSANIAIKPGNFGLYNNKFGNWLMNFDAVKNYMAIGNDVEAAQLPKSRLHVFNGDINVDQIGKGIILKSPSGGCWRITVDDLGNLIRTSIPCPN